MTVNGIGASGGAAQGMGGALLERAQHLAAEAPKQAEAFRSALQAAESSEGTALSPADGANRASGVLGAGPAEGPSEGPSDGVGGAEQMLRQVEAGHVRLTEILGELDSGSPMSAHRMLGLQAEMHQIMRRLETATKVMGEVVSGAKTLMQQQV
ncbi:MAG: hypothetical protein AAGN66_01075 [Acidobacteriota bacterium]